MSTIDYRGIEFKTAGDAIQYASSRHAEFGGRGVAVLLDGKHMLIAQADADRLAAAGVTFAYLGEVATPGGEFRIVTIPIN